MIDVDGVSPLITVRCPNWPLRSADAIERSPDHRRLYLTYEGPVSANRGQVHRVASGNAAIDQSGRLEIDGKIIPIHLDLNPETDK